MKLAEIIRALEQWAPPSYQESYDNSGLITGDKKWELSGVLISLDCIESVVDEAISKGCNLIVAHHPIVFRGLKSLTGKNYVERTLIKAIKNDVAIYAIHTNLDNVHTGVNKKIAETIGLQNVKILSPKNDTLSKLVAFVPTENKENVLTALHGAGAGTIGNYSDCSFSSTGTGTFTPNGEADPHIGESGKSEQVTEERIELIFSSHNQNQILSTLKKAHPYEEVAYYITQLLNTNQDVGAGMVGDLNEKFGTTDFIKLIKEKFNLSVVRHTDFHQEKIQRVAVCGGAGSFLLSKAKAANADVFITADYKYHEFFDADKQITIFDIGHYESEVFTKELIYGYLKEKFANIALHLSEVVTNPIKYS